MILFNAISLNQSINNNNSNNLIKSTSQYENSIYVDYEIGIDPRYNQNISDIQRFMNDLYATPGDANNPMLGLIYVPDALLTHSMVTDDIFPATTNVMPTMISSRVRVIVPPTTSKFQSKTKIY